MSYSAESRLGRILREVHGAALERCPAHNIDFGAEFTPELQAQEERLRAEVEGQKGGPR